MKKFWYVMLLLSSQIAAAQTPAPVPALPAAENSKQACQDRIDNDGDGHVDCDDQDCADFVFCARAAAPEQQPEPRALRSRAAVEITLGSILFAVGGTMLASSGAIWWAAGSNTDPTRNAAGAGALSMDVVGFAALVSGIALIPIGIGHRVHAASER